MIKTELLDERLIKSYSDGNKMIKPVYDRLGKAINSNAIYDVAIDVIVDGNPRYCYEETDIEIKHINEDELQNKVRDVMDTNTERILFLDEVINEDANKTW